MALPNEIHPFAIAGGGNQYQVANSLRFRGSGSAYLTKTWPSNTGSRTTWTWSGWVKRGSLTYATATLFAGFTANFADRSRIYFEGDDTLNFLDYIGSVITARRSTNAKFRDPSAWYHVVCTYDTTNATAANRVRLYVNNTLQTYSTTVDPSQNYASGKINDNVEHNIGRLSTEYFDGYIAEVNFIDTQALDPTYFGQTDSITNQWVPKKYTGSYGTNGFYLSFNKSTVSGENDAYTAFLAHFNSFNDTSNSGKSITTYGTAAISSAQAKFGTGSLYVNAASQTSGNAYIRTASSSDFNIGAVSGNTNDFTFEFWYYVPNATNAWPYYPVLAISDSTYSPFLLLAGSFYSSSNGSSWDIASGKSAGTPTPSAWNHYAFVRSGNTWYIFLNGVQQDTWTSNSTPQALSSYLQIGRIQGGSAYTNGYFDEVRWSKGVARYTANFTVPSGPFTGGIGYDAANDCHWTPSGISVTSGSTYDVMIDSPTDYNDGGNNRGNYCTFNPTATSSRVTLSNGSLTATKDSFVDWNTTLSTYMVSSGKWYYEFLLGTTTNKYFIIGYVKPDFGWWNLSEYPGKASGSYGLDCNSGNKRTGDVSTSYGSGFVSADIAQVALDLDNGKIWWGKNGTWFASGDPAAGTNAAYTSVTGPLIPALGMYTSETGSINFGQRPFSYTPPSGFKALNSYNLANPSLPLV